MRKLSKREKNLVAIAVFMIVMVIAVGSTYAFWTTTQVQTDKNEINTTCLSVELLNKKSESDTEETTKGITLEKAYPISDTEGLDTTGYTFTIKNNCDTEVYYDVNLESLKINGQEYAKKTTETETPEVQAEREKNSTYLQSEYIKTVINPPAEGEYKVLSAYTDVTNSSLEEGANNYEYKNLLHSQKLDAQASVTHTLKMWVDENAPMTQMNKHYQGKIVVYSWLGKSNPYPLGE